MRVFGWEKVRKGRLYPHLGSKSGVATATQAHAGLQLNKRLCLEGSCVSGEPVTISPGVAALQLQVKKKLTRRTKAGFFFFSSFFQVIYGGFETSCLSDPPQLLPESLFIFQSFLMEGSPLAAPRPRVCMYLAESFHCSGKGLKPVCQKSDRGINGLRGGWGVGALLSYPFWLNL